MMAVGNERGVISGSTAGEAVGAAGGRAAIERLRRIFDGSSQPPESVGNKSAVIVEEADWQPKLRERKPPRLVATAVEFPIRNCLNGCTGHGTVEIFRPKGERVWQAAACCPIGEDLCQKPRTAFDKAVNRNRLPCQQCNKEEREVLISTGTGEKVFGRSQVRL